jgi:hypothetical protein
MARTFLGRFGRPVGSERGRSGTCRAALYFGSGARPALLAAAGLPA